MPRIRIKTPIAVFLIVVGIAGFAYQGVEFMTFAHPPSVDSGPTDQSEPLRRPLPAVIGVLALIAGIALLLVDGGDLDAGRSVTAARRR